MMHIEALYDRPYLALRARRSVYVCPLAIDVRSELPAVEYEYHEFELEFQEYEWQCTGHEVYDEDNMAAYREMVAYKLGFRDETY